MDTVYHANGYTIEWLGIVDRLQPMIGEQASLPSVRVTIHATGEQQVLYWSGPLSGDGGKQSAIAHGHMFARHRMSL